MDEKDRLLIEEACKRAMVGYCVHADHNDAEAFANVFAEDGAWVQGGGEEVRGRAALAQYIRNKSAKGLTRHFMTNMLVDVIDENRAKGVAYVMAIRDKDFEGKGLGKLQPPNGVSEYQDEFVRTKDGWRISRRRTVALFK